MIVYEEAAERAAILEEELRLGFFKNIPRQLTLSSAFTRSFLFR